MPKELNKDTEITLLTQLNPRKTLEDMPVVLIKMKVLSKVKSGKYMFINNDINVCIFNFSQLVSDDWECELVLPGGSDFNARFADVYYLICELLSDVHAVMLRLNIPLSEEESSISKVRIFLRLNGPSLSPLHFCRSRTWIWIGYPRGP